VFFAQRYLGGTASALGKRLTRSREKCEIVGVIRDNEWQSLHEVRPFFALPLLQSDQTNMTLIVMSSGDPATLIGGVRRAIQARDPTMPVRDIQTVREYFSVTAYPFRLVGLVLGACGVMALLLATIGIYGTVAYSVAQRRREVGIRMALGAVRTDIIRLVVRHGMTLVAYGLVIGLLLGAALTRVLTTLPIDTTLLFGVSATDTLTFAGVTAFLALVALIACYLPAMRATNVDPVVTLRGS
jgi:putative ABC transport system permease protein